MDATDGTMVQVRTQGSVNGINVRTGVGVSKEKRDAETRVGRPPLLLAGNAPDRLHGTSLGRF